MCFGLLFGSLNGRWEFFGFISRYRLGTGVGYSSVRFLAGAGYGQARVMNWCGLRVGTV